MQSEWTGYQQVTTARNARLASVALSMFFLLVLAGCQSLTNYMQASDVCDQQAMQEYPPVLRQQEYQGSERVEVFDGTERCVTTVELGTVVEKCKKGTKIDYRPVAMVRTIDLNASNRSAYSSQCIPNYCMQMYGNPACNAAKQVQTVSAVSASPRNPSPPSSNVKVQQPATAAVVSTDTSTEEPNARIVLSKYFGQSWVADPIGRSSALGCPNPYHFEFSEITLVTRDPFNSKLIGVVANNRAIFSCKMALYYKEFDPPLSKEQLAEIKRAFSDLGANIRN